MALVSAGFVIALAGMAAKARRRPVVSGTPHMIGTIGEVIAFDAGQGWATVEGERWQVRAAEPLQAGQRVRIDKVEGLTLDVTPIAEAATWKGISR